MCRLILGYITLGNIQGQLSVLKVTEKEINTILSVDLHDKILAVQTLTSPNRVLTINILLPHAIIKHEMQSDQGK